MEQSNKIQRVVNGLSQMNSNSHAQMGELQDKLTSSLTLSFLSYLTFLVIHFQLEVTSF